MADIIFFLLSTIGLTNIVVESDMPLVVLFRNKGTELLGDTFNKLVTCHQCCGFWCGMICGAIVISQNPFWILASGFAGSFVSPAYMIINDYIVSKTEFVIGDVGDDSE